MAFKITSFGLSTMVSSVLILSLEVVAIAYILVCLAMYRWQNRFIFFPSSEMPKTPKQLGFTYEDIWLSVGDDPQAEKINAWWLPNTSNSSDVLLYLHGNSSNISGNLNHGINFHSQGFSVLLIDYRGYGRSEGGFPREATVYQDAQIAWDYLVNQRGYQPENIFVYGHSLGGAIAIDLMVRKPTTAGVIVQGSFTSMRAMVKTQKIYDLLPIDLILNQRFDSLSKISLLRMPILFIHGTEDEIVPAAMSQILFDAATVPKKILFVPHAGHDNVSSVSGQEYWQTIRDFCEMVKNTPIPLKGL